MVLVCLNISASQNSAFFKGKIDEQKRTDIKELNNIIHVNTKDGSYFTCPEDVCLFLKTNGWSVEEVNEKYFIKSGMQERNNFLFNYRMTYFPGLRYSRAVQVAAAYNYLNMSKAGLREGFSGCRGSILEINEKALEEIGKFIKDNTDN